MKEYNYSSCVETIIRNPIYYRKVNKYKCLSSEVSAELTCPPNVPILI